MYIQIVYLKSFEKPGKNFLLLQVYCTAHLNCTLPWIHLKSLYGEKKEIKGALKTLCPKGIYKLQFFSCIYLSTAGTTPHAPQVGAVTMVPQSAFCSLTAKA